MTWLYALSECFTCATVSTDSLHNYGSRNNRPPHGDEHADAVSLHSNLGPDRVTKGRRRRQRQDDGWLKFFGYNVFGKRKPAIQLPLTDDEEEGGEPSEGRSDTSGGRISRGTLDSDAAPLDDEVIAAISAHGLHAPSFDGGSMNERLLPDDSDLRERVKQAEKEERRRKRRERKEREALERALTAGGGFEGFQGSGDGLSAGPGLRSSSGRTGATSTTGDDADEEADLDGSVYARPVPSAISDLLNSGSRTTTTRSSDNTSGSQSQSQSHHRSRRPRTHTKAADQFHEDMLSPTTDSHIQKKKKIRKPAPLGSTGTESTWSPSLPSPTASTSLGTGLSHSLSPPLDVVETLSVKIKDRTIFSEEEPFVAEQAPQVLVSDNRGFPSVGFGRPRRGRGDSLSNGAFLARRGDD